MDRSAFPRSAAAGSIVVGLLLLEGLAYPDARSDGFSLANVSTILMVLFACLVVAFPIAFLWRHDAGAGLGALAAGGGFLVLLLRAQTPEWLAGPVLVLMGGALGLLADAWKHGLRLLGGPASREMR